VTGLETAAGRRKLGAAFASVEAALAAFNDNPNLRRLMTMPALPAASAFGSLSRQLEWVKGHPALLDGLPRLPAAAALAGIRLPSAERLAEIGAALGRLPVLQPPTEEERTFPTVCIPPPRQRSDTLTINVNVTPDEETAQEIFAAGVREGLRQALAAQPGTSDEQRPQAAQEGSVVE
jgi:hypothetical protein